MVSATAEEVLPYRAWLEGLVGMPSTDGNNIEALRNGNETFPAMLDAIGAATVSVDFSTFIFRGR